MEKMRLRQMQPEDRSEVADLICVSLNHWYLVRGGTASFPDGPAPADVFFDIYEALDPGCGLVAENDRTGRLMGSCFYHPRKRHVSLGIMNVHPNYFGQGVARTLVRHIVDYADSKGYPAVRLTSSALNLDSFSLYTRAGFVPRFAYQDMIVSVPDSGFEPKVPGQEQVRPATEADLPAMAALEMDVSGISREEDYRFALENQHGIWEAFVYEGQRGAIDGYMISGKHAAMRILGPCVARTEREALALIVRALDRYRGGQAVVLVPVHCAGLVAQMYGWGARNCELHFCQVRGDFQPLGGVVMPTFLLETG